MRSYWIWVGVFVLNTHLVADSLFLQDDRSKQAHELNVLRIEGLAALDSHNYIRSEQIFEQILALDPREWLDEVEYNEIVLALAKSQILKGRLSAGEQTFYHLLPSGMTLPIRFQQGLLKAKILELRKDLLRAFICLKILQNEVPLSSWPLEEQKGYLKLKEKVEQELDVMWLRAESCFNKGLYAEARTLYDEIYQVFQQKEGLLESKEEKRLYQLLIQKSRCAYGLHSYPEAIALLEETKKNFPAWFDSDSFYLLIEACEKNLDFSKALELSYEYLTYRYGSVKQEKIEVYIGILLKKLNRSLEALEAFKKLQGRLKDPLLQAKLHLELAALFLETASLKEAEEALRQFKISLCEDPVLIYQARKLDGSLLFMKKDYLAALTVFQNLLQDQGAFKKSEEPELLYQLAYSAFKLGEEELEKAICIQRWELSEQYFKQLLIYYPSDRIATRLGQLYKKRYDSFQEASIYEKFHHLITSFRFHTLESEIELNGLWLEVVDNVKEKEDRIQILLAPPYDRASNYGKVWYYLGRLSQETGKPINEQVLFFKKAYHLLKDQSIQGAVLALQGWKQALLQDSDLFNASQAIEEWDLLQQDLPLSSLVSEYLKLNQVELLLKLGLQKDFQKNQDLLTLLQTLKTSQTPYIQESALYLFSHLSLYHKNYKVAQQSLSDLLHLFPHTQYAPEAYFWMAECLEHQGASLEQVKQCRETIFKTYPYSPYAVRAYFLQYPLKEYIEGNPLAMAHLRSLESMFPSSNYSIVVQYVLGLYEKQRKHWDKAIACFVQAENLFWDFWKQGKIESQKAYFSEMYYQAVLEEGDVYFTKARSSSYKRELYLQKSLERYAEVYEDLQDLKHGMASILQKEGLTDPLKEQALYYIGRLSAQLHSIEKAETCFKELTSSVLAPEKKSPFLSKAWYELGQIYLAKEEYQMALNAFLRAEETYLAEEEKDAVEFMIQQSLCYRFLQNIEQAEFLLSQALEKASEPSQKEKVHFLRGELYVLQGNEQKAEEDFKKVIQEKGYWKKIALQQMQH